MMLTLLTGINPASKREYITQSISRALDENKKVILLVPEQSSFDRDRAFLLRYGERKSNQLKVTGLSHFAEDILEEYGENALMCADDTAKAVLMSLAIEQASEISPLFTKYAGGLYTVEQILALYTQMKQTGLSSEELRKASFHLSGLPGKKAFELAHVFDVYDALISQNFSQEFDKMKLAEKTVIRHRPYEKTVFYIDDFRGFTAVQIQFISALIAGSENCYISVFAPNLTQNEENEAYMHALINAQKLSLAAKKYGISVCTENTDMPDEQTDMANLRRNMFSLQKNEDLPAPQNIHILSSSNPKAECDAVALKIQKLLASGYRCRDIGVIERAGNLTPMLMESLKKYGIPVFEDKRRPLFASPLVRFILSTVGIAAKGFDTELLLAQIKTGISGIADEDCTLLEMYAFRWQISFSMWEHPFTGHPDGFGNVQTPESQLILERINSLREQVVAPLQQLREQFRQNDGCNDCRQLFAYLQSVNAGDNFRAYAESLAKNGEEERAVEAGNVWDTVVACLNSLYTALQKLTVSPKRFYEFMQLLLCAGTNGTIPAGIDEIVIGQADRTRFISAKHVFVLGCNEGIFPENTGTAGVFTAVELRKLSESGFVLESLPENRYREERLIVMQAVFSPQIGLTVSYSNQSLEGVSMQKSEIVTEIERIFPTIKTEKDEDTPLSERLCSFQAGFEEYAKLQDKNTPTALALKKALLKNADYTGKIAVLEKAENKQPFVFSDCDVARELFGNNIYFSASKAECYHKCPFMFFCRYGIKAEKTRYSTVDARINGLLVHKVLEDVLRENTSLALSEKTKEEIVALAKEKVLEFEKESLSGSELLTGQVKRELERCEKRVCEILCRIASEFNHCAFQTVAVEMKIGGDDAEIPYYVLKLPDGASVALGGSIDRVDAMVDNGHTYLRVIDYKTGGKEFKLSDVFDGLSMQMLLYLFALIKNGKDKFSNPLPAGILYVPANTSGEMLQRDADDEQIQKQKLANGRMNGLLLESATVIKGMEAGARGIYINASIDDDGKLIGKFLTLDEFDKLNKKIDSILIETAQNVRNGIIEAKPMQSTGQSACLFCDYAEVCLHEDGDAVATPLGLSHKDAVALLNEEVH